MSDTEYLTATMTVGQTPDEVFAAITNVRGWWSENVIGDTAALHDEFVFTDDCTHPGEAAHGRQGIRFARFQLTEVLPGRRRGEPRQLLRILQDAGPFVSVVRHMFTHRGLEFIGDAEAAFDHDRTQVIQPTVQRLDPGGGALQPIRGPDVEHQKPVDVADQRLGVHIGYQKLGVPRTEPAVPAHIEVPAV